MRSLLSGAHPRDPFALLPGHDDLRGRRSIAKPTYTGNPCFFTNSFNDTCIASLPGTIRTTHSDYSRAIQSEIVI